MKNYIIVKSVPKINEEVIGEARKYRSSNSDLFTNLYESSIRDHHPSSLEGSMGEERMKSLEDLVNLYIYFKETKSDNIDYRPYIETMEDILIDGTIIPSKSASFPVDQMKLRSIERIVVDVIKHLCPNDSVEFPEVIKGKQDYGVDFIWRGYNIDVKTTSSFDKKNNKVKPINYYTNLCTFKEKALTDNTKKTDYILWTISMLEEGFVYLVGMEKWENVVKDAIFGDTWNKWVYWKFNIPMYSRKLKDFNGIKFKRRFIGEFDKDKQERLKEVFCV